MSKSVFVQRLDIVQAEIWQKLLKPKGFKKRGRTFNRETPDGLIQVISLNIGMAYRGDNDLFCVSIGIRVPESFEKTFDEPEKKSFYQEYYCNIRTTLNDGTLGHARYETKTIPPRYYGTKVFMLDIEDMQPNIDEIIETIESHVFPFFDNMDTREKVLKNRRMYNAKYKDLEMCNTITLEEAMIYGRAGDIEKATQLMQQHYNNSQHHKPHQGYVFELSKKLGITLDVKTI